MEKKKQVLVIHGGTPLESRAQFLDALRKKVVKLERILSEPDWKSELSTTLGQDYLVYTPQMPNKQCAEYEEWKILFEKIIELLDDEFILIGHSLGAIFLIKYLSENTISKKIAKTFIVAGAFDNTGMEEEPLYSFLNSGDISNLEKQAGKLFFYHSEDDLVVPFCHIDLFKKVLPHATYRIFKDKMHFHQDSIPGLVEDIKN